MTMTQHKLNPLDKDRYRFRRSLGDLARCGRRLNQTGAAEIVQFAILAPIALVLMIGIVELSVAFLNQAIITNASRVGAREAVRAIAPAGGWAQLGTRVATSVEGASAGLLRWGNSPATPTVVLEPANPMDAGEGSEIAITVTYQHDLLFLPNVMGGIGTIDLEARTRMQVPERIE